jgi:hypothetical protein
METLSRKVPAGLQRDVYHWRMHVGIVRADALDRLGQMQQHPSDADSLLNQPGVTPPSLPRTPGV